MKPHFVVALSLATLLACSLAHAADDSALANCALIPNATQRLACYDNLIPPVTNSSAEPLGSEQLQSPEYSQRPSISQTIVARIVAHTKTSTGRFVITLDNNQVWQQIDGDSAAAAFRQPGMNRVKISRGALGSYNLVLNDSGSLFKVKRVK